MSTIKFLDTEIYIVDKNSEEIELIRIQNKLDGYAETLCRRCKETYFMRFHPENLWWFENFVVCQNCRTVKKENEDVLEKS